MYILSIAYTTKENLNIIVSQAVSSKMLQTSKQTKLRNKQLFKQTTKISESCIYYKRNFVREGTFK